MDNSTPYEIIGAPFEMWVSPVGTAFPAVDEEPQAPWALIGTSGNLNHTQEGITVSHSQSMNFFRASGDCGSRKAFRTDEDLKIALAIADLSLEQYQHALNGNTVSETPASAGVAGTKKIGLSRGFAVATHALLLRGPSPEMADGACQVPGAARGPDGQPGADLQERRGGRPRARVDRAGRSRRGDGRRALRAPHRADRGCRDLATGSSDRSSPCGPR